MSDHDDLHAQLAVEGRLAGWQVYRAREPRCARGADIPAGSYWAAHWHPDEPLVIAADLAELERLVGERTPPTTPTPQRSVMRELLTPDQIRHLEVAEGRWYLPGPTP
jgi:hypothetical protein